MVGMSFRDAYEFDPAFYAAEGAGGLLGRLQAVLPRATSGPDPDANSPPNVGLEYDPDSYNPPQAGLLGRLRELQEMQSQYKPIPADNARAPFVPHDADFRQLTRVPIQSTTPTVAQAPAGPPSESDHGQRTRDSMVGRLAEGIRTGRADIPAIDLPTINGVARAFSNGVPVAGAFNNNIEAALAATLSPALNPLFEQGQRLNQPSWRERYAHAVQTQNDIDARFAKENPVTAWIANTAGGMVASPILGGTRLGAKMLGLAEGPLAERMLRSATTNAAIWGADAAARGNTDKSLSLSMAAGAARPAARAAWDAIVKSVSKIR